jgi:PKD repeat protein|tara:strand:- start:10314 stop:14366 length:4053 start_codon:yes stop_codon:yes gene_type:complete
LFILSAFSPLVSSTSTEENEKEEYMINSLSDFSPDVKGKEYMFNGDDLPIYSATGILKTQWIDDGYPGIVFPFATQQSSRSSIRSCENTWSVGESDNITTSTGSISATVQRISTNSAIFVEDGKVVSSIILSDIVSTWESTIYPTDVNYFGSPPDVDNNCQIEIVIYEIDGTGSIGGYFQPGISAIRESLFFDLDDMNSRNTILAHEFEHLLHNSRDPFEYLWIDEGAADMAAFLCFGVNNALSAHVNHWSENSSISLRWWNDRLADYGAGFLFMMYLADKLGGGDAITRLIADTSVGGSSIENLAINPEPGSTSIGNNMNDIFANFSAAVSLDSPQGVLGFSNLDLTDACEVGTMCRVQLSGMNEQWSSDWQSDSQSIEGWGMRSFEFSQGTGQPLNLMIVPLQFGFAGSILVKEAATGTWSMSKLRVDASTGIGTGLVHDFGNLTSEVLLLVWYNSPTDDCDYNFVNCGIMPSSYPSATFTVHAGLITVPAEVSIDSITSFDRDIDQMDDSIEIGFEVVSNAFYELIEIRFEAYINNTLTDFIELEIIAGSSEPAIELVWFTPPYSGEWTFGVEIYDITGRIQDSAYSLPQPLTNMAPSASGSISTNITQTWTNVNIYGGGYDIWGFGEENGTFNHNETPIGYIWDLGDGQYSNLKNPTHSYNNEGNYTITLIIKDQGGYFSESQTWDIFVNDSSTPDPIISVEGIEILDELIILTNQNIRFSAIKTEDNVPINNMNYSWDWGDGGINSGIGLYEIDHSWIDGDADGIAYLVTLAINDGKHFAEKTIQIRVLNRVPELIFEDMLETDTLTPLIMPNMFTDNDGLIVHYEWTFEGGVNLSGSGVSLTSDFTSEKTLQSNPQVSWLNPGIKNISLDVTDDDGNVSSHSFQVEVNNQRPVAVFNRPSDGFTDTAYVFESLSFDSDGDSSKLLYLWNISDMNEPIYNISSISRTFTKPGLYSISLMVTDERGTESAVKAYYFRIDNPLPVPIISFRQPSINGTVSQFIPEDLNKVTWQVPNLEGGGLFISPNMPIIFDGTESYDSDIMFIGKKSMNRDDPDWNGITKWIWDFGDASPTQIGPIAWHSYDLPGIYVVQFTVLDDFESGESNTTSIIVHVSVAPEITTISPIFGEYVTVGDAIDLMINVSDYDLNFGIEAWMDIDANQDSDGDGNSSNDKDINLADSLSINWDFDVFEDSNFDGNYRNDWVSWVNRNWEEPGDVRISVEVCDGVNVCSSKDYIITVLSVRDDSKPKTLTDLTWNDLIPKKESWGILALVAAVSLLGWLVMRQKNEDEINAEDMMESYGLEVKLEGGLPGMDQHSPPPRPRYLTMEERKNKESGYIRPIRTRRGK